MFPIVQIGPAAIQTSGLILILGLWLGLNLAEKYCLRHGIQPSLAYAMVAIALITAAVGGRLTFAVENFSAFAASPISLISLNLNLWDLPGGVTLSLAACIGYGLRYKINFWSLLDSLTPTFAVIMIVLGVANLASGNAFGAPARLPWSIFLWGEWRHPSQVYETLGAIVVLLWVLLWLKRFGPNSASRSAPGILFLEFVAWSAALRIFLEIFRGDGTLIFSQIRSSQVIAWIILAACLFLLGKRKYHETVPSDV